MSENASPIEHPSSPPSSKEARIKQAHQETRAARIVAFIFFFLIGVLYLLLPSYLRLGPPWLLLALEALALIPVILSWTMHHPLSHRTTYLLILTALTLITLALALSVGLLIATLPLRLETGSLLLRTAIALWSLNVLIFALWYWEIDGGGPLIRHLNGYRAADFQFPQQLPMPAPGWRLHFPDYLFLAFCTATALSPADTLPLSQRAKMLMMFEAIISLGLTIFLAARAVNIV